MAMDKEALTGLCIVDARHILLRVFTAYSRALLYGVTLYLSTLSVH